jgi:hypothetical protein
MPTNVEEVMMRRVALAEQVAAFDKIGGRLGNTLAAMLSVLGPSNDIERPSLEKAQAHLIGLLSSLNKWRNLPHPERVKSKFKQP